MANVTQAAGLPERNRADCATVTQAAGLLSQSGRLRYKGIQNPKSKIQNRTDGRYPHLQRSGARRRLCGEFSLGGSHPGL
ncbi:MAG: hypothetical protein AB1791_03310 [Chloroflexota bacterium]